MATQAFGSRGESASHDDSPPWLDRGLLLALILVSFALHMWRLDAKSIWWDESLSLYRAQRDIPYILSNRIDFPGSSTTDLHPALYFLVLHVVVSLWGETDLVLRFPSVLFATLTVPVLYALGARIHDRRAGTLAALCGALSPFYLWYAQEARMYALVTWLGAVGCYALWRALSEKSSGWALASGAATTAAVATQYLSALLVAPQALLAVCMWPGPRGPRDVTQRSRQQPRRGRPLLWVAAGLAVVVVYLGIQAGRLALEPKAGREFVPLWVMLPDALSSYSLGTSVSTATTWPLVACFVAVYLVGVMSVWRHPRCPRPSAPAVHGPWRCRAAGLVVLIGYPMLPVVLMWLFSFLQPVYMSSRYAIMFSPAYYVGLGIGLSALWTWKPGAGGIALSIAILGMGYATGRYFAHPDYRTKEDYRSAAQYVALNERIGDIVIVNAPENMPAFKHYYVGHMPLVGMPSVALAGDADSERVAREMTELASSCDRLWLVHCRTMFSDPGNVVQQWLDHNTLLLERKVFPSYGSDVSVAAYAARFPLVSQAAASGAALGAFGEALQLRSYRLRGLDSAGQAREGVVATEEQARVLRFPSSDSVLAGTTLAVDLDWSPSRQLIHPLKTSLRLVDQRGVIWAQRDRLPYMHYSTTQWPVAGLVRQQAALPIPCGTPPAVYALQLAVYEEESLRLWNYQAPGNTNVQQVCTLAQVAIGSCTSIRTAQQVVSPTVRPCRAAVFGGELRLVGYDLPSQALRAGGSALVELYWCSLRKPREDYELVINWQDETGRVWHSADYPLLGVDYPSSSWLPSEVLRGLVQLMVPADASRGTHRLHLLVRPVGSARYLWLARGPIPWAGHDFDLGTITLE